MQSRGELYLSIHYLRAIAALMVVARHCIVYAHVPISDRTQFVWLGYGVALFFVISGFVMVASTQGRDMTPREFLVKRAVRIAPLYCVITLAWAAMIANWDIARLLHSFAFVFYRDPVTGAISDPVLEPGWTLNFEMFFYAVFAASLMIPSRARLWCVGAFFALILALAPLEIYPPQLQRLAHPFLVLFVGGMAIARLGLRLPAVFLPVGLGMLAFAGELASNIWIAQFLPVMMIVMAARSFDGRLPEWRMPMLLGDASYAIYLSHIMVMQVGVMLVLPALPGLLGFAWLMLVSTLVGIAIHLWVEQPLTHGIRRLARRRDAKVADGSLQSGRHSTAS
ncbi:acyltransferase family protein [Aurantiacibacter rhizosphaerae]|nr:acyltransferase [Aurantiacibacter rhizosphaerae]